MDLLDDAVILILNYNSYKLTINNVKKILKLNCDIRIVIVDNCSTDNSLNEISNIFCHYENVHILNNKRNTGYAAGNNFGLKFIEKNMPEVKYVTIMNPDIELMHEDTLIRLRNVLKNDKNLAIVSCQTIFNNEWRGFTDIGWKFPSYKNLCLSGTLLGKLCGVDVNDSYSSFEIKNDMCFIDVIPGCFFMANMDFFKEVGYFDESTFLYFEELILSNKFSRINKKEAVIIDDFVYHNHQIKDSNVKNYNHRLFDRKCFHDSKIYFVKNYANLNKVKMMFCLLINNVDFIFKSIYFNIRKITQRS